MIFYLWGGNLERGGRGVVGNPRERERGEYGILNFHREFGCHTVLAYLWFYIIHYVWYIIYIMYHCISPCQVTEGSLRGWGKGNFIMLFFKMSHSHRIVLFCADTRQSHVLFFSSVNAFCFKTWKGILGILAGRDTTIIIFLFY